jgi:UDP-N-acetylmuramoyl-L-alanyl-D-glutamate--2,6-diaminopimelate ligase
MDLDALIEGLSIVRTGGPGGGAIRICDITEDSRTVMPGSLFVARRGEKSDGRAFIPAAVAAGAVAVLIDRDPAVKTAPIDLPTEHGKPAAVLLVTNDLPLAVAQLAERFYGSPSTALSLIGVTGTNGKTTVTFLIHQLLNQAPPERGGRRCGLIGTVCVDDGVEVAPSTFTTPPALEVSRTLARMVEASCRAAVMETSSHALHQKRVGALRFAVGVFTNLTHDHLDYHKTMENYAASKARLFEMLPSESEGGVAVVNADDPWTPRMIRDCKARVVLCSTNPRAGADWTIRALKGDARRTTVRITAPRGQDWTLTLPLIGAHNLMNAVQAAAAAHAAGLSPDAVRAGLEKVTAPPGRLEPITPVGAPVAVYVDYAHTDDALTRALSVVREAMTGGPRAAKTAKAAGSAKTTKAAKPRRWRLIVVFGCGGDRDATKRPKMGKAAAALADVVYITSDNPRTEDPGAIIEQIVAGVPAAGRAALRIEPDREKAIFAAVAAARKGDVVLIAGKGHEDYQILSDGRGGTVKRDFDDRLVGRAALEAAALAVAKKRPAAKPAKPARSDKAPVPKAASPASAKTPKPRSGSRPARGPSA